MDIGMVLAAIKWHFLEAPFSIAKGALNILWFNFHYFSVDTLVRSLFSPWRRQTWSYGKGFDLGRYLEVFFSNMISRVIGAVVRLSVITLGLIGGMLVLAASMSILLLWYLTPIGIFFAFFHGIRILF
ncbi:MAG: hypothetical protein Q8P39_01330 [Candidatus Yanofskybacteria bacterium]|nr:hypothetical protein [Candidatus Yanofskybacteria bacterium]